MNFLSEHLPPIWEREHFFRAVWRITGVCGQEEGTGHLPLWCGGFGCDTAVSVRKGLREGFYNFAVSPFQEPRDLSLKNEQNKK